MSAVKMTDITLEQESPCNKKCNKDVMSRTKNEIFKKRPMTTKEYNKNVAFIRKALSSVIEPERLLFLMFFICKIMHGDIDCFIYTINEAEKNRIILALILFDDIYNNENEHKEEDFDRFRSDLIELEEDTNKVKVLFRKKGNEISNEKDKCTMVFLNIILEIKFTPTLEMLRFQHITSSFSANLILGILLGRFNLKITPDGFCLKIRISKHPESRADSVLPPLYPI